MAVEENDSLSYLQALKKGDPPDPAAQRKLVTSHDTFGYFSKRYGFKVVGTALTSFSTETADPSAAEFAKAKDQTRDQLLQQKRNELFALFASNVREQMEKQGKIRINQPLLKQLTTPRSQEGS